MKKNLFRRFYVISLSIGIGVGLVFPVFAGFFTEYKSPELALPFTLLCVGAGILVVMTSFFIAKSTFIKSLQTLKNQINSMIENGDLSKSISVSSNDEIGITAGIINLLIDNFRKLIREVHASFQTASTSAEGCLEVTAEMNKNREQAEKVSEDTDQKWKALRDETSHISLSLKNMTNKMYGMLKKIEAQGEIFKDFFTLFEQVSHSIDFINLSATDRKTEMVKLSDAVNSGVQRITENNHHLKRLEKDSDEMMEIVMLISDVADRTNMLAMNAAIEAAHAGAFGAGFSIVAQEIRNLSRVTYQNTEKISKSLQHTIDKDRKSVV